MADCILLGSIGLLLFGSIMAFWMKPSNRLPAATTTTKEAIA